MFALPLLSSFRQVYVSRLAVRLSKPVPITDPALDEKRAAATRRADVSGAAQWAVLDRALEVGHEIGRWRLEEIVWAEVAGDTAASISDHAAVCYERPPLHEVDEAEGRPALPKMKAWGERHHRQYAKMTEGAADRAEEAAGGDLACDRGFREDEGTIRHGTWSQRRLRYSHWRSRAARARGLRFERAKRTGGLWALRAAPPPKPNQEGPCPLRCMVPAARSGRPDEMGSEATSRDREAGWSAGTVHGHPVDVW